MIVLNLNILSYIRRNRLNRWLWILTKCPMPLGAFSCFVTLVWVPMCHASSRLPLYSPNPSLLRHFNNCIKNHSMQFCLEVDSKLMVQILRNGTGRWNYHLSIQIIGFRLPDLELYYLNINHDNGGTTLMDYGNEARERQTTANYLNVKLYCYSVFINH